jgi:bacterioferritin-associated ferredoxin
MFVCICNAVTDRQIRSQAECCRGSVAQIYRALGAKVQCGRCVPAAKSIIDGLRPLVCDAAIPAFDAQQMPACDVVSIPDFGGMQRPARDIASLPAFAMAD